jgi:hypothetical protein
MLVALTLPQTVHSDLTSLGNDPHLVVRYLALHTLGQIVSSPKRSPDLIRWPLPHRLSMLWRFAWRGLSF